MNTTLKLLDKKESNTKFEIYSEELLLEVSEYKPEQTIDVYKCFICDKTFQNEHKFRQHFISNQQNNDDKFYQCTACSEQFQFNKDFNAHKCDYIDFDDPILRMDTNNNVEYYCKFCSINNIQSESLQQSFRTFNEYSDHLNQVHNVKEVIKCSICKQITSNLSDYLNHLDSKHEISPINNQCLKTVIKCGLCKFETINSKLFKDHLVKMHINNTNSKVETKRRVFCSQCKLLFQYQHDFELHLFKHIRQSSSLYCPICVTSTNFDSLDSFDLHVNSHHLELKCGLCSQSLNDGKSFEEHLNTSHLNDLVVEVIEVAVTKPSITVLEVENVYCLKCNKYFASSTSLAIHLKQH